MIHILCGNGKGKTTSALGMAIRAAGHNKKVSIITFCKGVIPYYYGEIELLKNNKTNIDVKQFGASRIVYKNNIQELDKMQAIDAYCEFFSAIKYKELVIADEISVCMDLQMITPGMVINAIKPYKEKQHMDIVLTGRDFDSPFIEIADYVTEFKEIKHPYKGGIQARRGIEF
jgi:cob(I)alamin adenosyltransferase